MDIFEMRVATKKVKSNGIRIFIYLLFL